MTPSDTTIPLTTDADRIIRFLFGASAMEIGMTFQDIRHALPNRSDASISHTLSWLERDRKIRC